MTRKLSTTHPGVYKITCIVTNQVYVGSSVCISKRWYWHKYKLSKGEHYNHLLQACFDEYGEDSLIYEVIENLEGFTGEYIRKMESHYIQKLDPKLNIIKEVSLFPDLKGTKNPQSKLTEKQVYLIKCCSSQYMAAKQIKNVLGLKEISRMSVYEVCTGTTWKHIVVEDFDLVLYKVTTPGGQVIRTNYLQDLGNILDISPHHLFRIASNFKNGYFHDFRCEIEHLPEIDIVKNPKLLTCKNSITKFWGFLQDPTGQKHEIWALKNFCAKNNLDMNSIARVARGEWTHHKGWTIPVS